MRQKTSNVDSKDSFRWRADQLTYDRLSFQVPDGMKGPPRVSGYYCAHDHASKSGLVQAITQSPTKCCIVRTLRFALQCTICQAKVDTATHAQHFHQSTPKDGDYNFLAHNPNSKTHRIPPQASAMLEQATQSLADWRGGEKRRCVGSSKSLGLCSPSPSKQIEMR